MMKLWGGRFTEGTDERAFAFNASLSYDRRLAAEDIRGSMAHAAMMKKQGILPAEDCDAIISGLASIAKDLAEGTLKIDMSQEDIHSFIESTLTERIGEPGRKLHTGRSRNDQVALDMRMYVRGEMSEVDAELRELQEVLLNIMEANLETWMPGFTHLQKAQPVTLAHHIGAYFEMFTRDRGRIADALVRMNECPLGASALAGTTYPLDREYVAELLEFDRATGNSMDSVSDRDYCIESLSALAMIMMHLSRFCEEVILWNSDEYRFIEISDGFSTGSSIMPQKKNPDIAELIRGKTGRVYGDLMSLLVTMKGIPLAYNKDMQEDKERVFDALDTVHDCVTLFTAMMAEVRFRPERMERSAASGFTNATDVADYLVRAGVPFRDAHGIVGALVLTCIDRGISLDELPLEEYRKLCPAFNEDIYEAISLKTCVERRVTKGAPSPESMREAIARYRAMLAEEDPS
ncbi:MAG: argininosuccinate lyase [Lachnospiraceae bacterium]|nr:argininosuccinate lyase [Lachnospiraceae bacterium]